MCNFHSLLFLPLSDNLKEITGFAGVDSPKLDVPTLPALLGLEAAPWSACKGRNEPRNGAGEGTAPAPTPLLFESQNGLGWEGP